MITVRETIVVNSKRIVCKEVYEVIVREVLWVTSEKRGLL